MSQQSHTNTFTKGMNLDVSPKLTKQDTYRKAVNAALRTNGNYFSLKNIQGSIAKGKILSSGNYDKFALLGVIPAKYYIVSKASIVKCLTLFAATTEDAKNYFKIYVYRSDNESIFLLYSKEVNSDEYFDISVDAKTASDGGVDTIYFVNNIDQPGRIRCILDKQLTDRDIELQRRYPSKSMEVSDIIYTPSTPPLIYAQHRLYFGNEAYGTDGPTTWESYSNDLLLDNDTQTGDSFAFSLKWSYDLDLETLVYDPAQPQCEASVIIEVRDINGTLVLNEHHTIIHSGIGNESLSDSGTINLTGSQIYNSSPVTTYMRIDLIIQGNPDNIYGLSRADLYVSSITETSGGDSYLIGSPYKQGLTSTAWA